MSTAQVLFAVAALVVFATALVVSLRFVGVVPGERREKRTHLLEDEDGERAALFAASERGEDANPEDAVARVRGGQNRSAESLAEGRITCPACRSQNRPGFSFCGRCGARLPGSKREEGSARSK